MDTRDCSGGFHRALVRVGGARRGEDVVAQSLRIEKRLLQHSSHHAANRRARDQRQRAAIDGDCSRIRFVKAQQQLHDGGLARARGTNQTQSLTSGEIETHIIKHQWSAAMRERNIAKRNRQSFARVRKRLGVRGVRIKIALLRLGQNLIKTRDSGQCLARFDHHASKHAHGPDEHRDDGEKVEVRAEFESTVGKEIRAQSHNDDLLREAHQIGDGPEACEQSKQMRVRFAKRSA